MPDKPAGCEITDAADADGMTLSWPAYKAGAGETSARWLAPWVYFWALGLLVALVALVISRGDASLWAWSVAWAVVGGAVTLALRNASRPPTPEQVRLEPHRLRYAPGHGPSEARSCAELPDGRVMPVTPAPATEVPKAAILGFGIDRVNDRQRLYFDTDDRRMEIGGCLTESERAWLFGVLQRWLGRVPRPAPWAKRAAVAHG